MPNDQRTDCSQWKATAKNLHERRDLIADRLHQCPNDVDAHRRQGAQGRCNSNRLSLSNIDVQYCPTEQMLADFVTRPLQGSLFRKFREVIMGQKHIDSLKTTTTNTSQERAEKDNLPEKKWNEIDGQKTDRRTTEPAKSTHAEITKKRKHSWKRE
jgi:hypothetical protein